MNRLGAATLGEVRGAILPGYGRDATGAGQVHLGVGAFMRAHLATYTEAALERDGGDWGIAGVSLRQRTVFDQLDPQDGLYTVRVADDKETTHRVVGALTSVHVAPEDPGRVVSLLADPRVAIVTLTVTEKGYSIAPSTGDLDLEHPGIRADLQGGGAPSTTLGFLAEGLDRRRRLGAPPITVLSCDNLPSNGRRLEGALRQFAERACPELTAWMDTNAAFPMTMVDRIVPATTEADLDAAARTLGVRDLALVKTEPFTQWVIEDRFAGPRPAWEAGGALFTGDVEVWETAKLRLLNGPHSALAYLGYLAGFSTIHEVVADPDFAAWARALMTREIAPVTPEPAGLDHATYIDDLLARFANSTLGHRTWQIAMDGSQKLPQRLLRTIRAQLEREGPIDKACLAVAAWMRYALGRDESGAAIDVQDPLASRFADIAAAGQGAADIAGRFLALKEVFGDELPANPRFRSAVESALARLLENGAAATVRDSLRKAAST